MRIFTTSTELPFAGHPSVGAAHTLVRTGRLPAGLLRQECGAGVLRRPGRRDGATLTGGPADRRGRRPGRRRWREAVGLSVADTVGLPAHVAGCGLPFTYLAVHPGMVDAAVPDIAALTALGVGEGVSVFSWDAAGSTAYARVFAGDVAWEDPATGSAALGLGVWLVDAGLVAPDATTSYVVRQGELLGRPSVLDCTVTASAGAAVTATVRGDVVPIASGTIRVPS